MPGGVHGLFAALPVAGIIFAYSGFEQADQLAGEIKNPGRNLPRAIIIAVLIGTLVYTLLQVALIGAMPGQPARATAGCNFSDKDIIAGPFAGLAGVVGLGWLAFVLRVDAIISPFGTGLIYTTGTSRISYGLARNRYVPQIFAKVDQPGHPVGQPVRRVHRRPRLPAAVPELALAGRPDHRGQRPHVRRARRCPWARSAARCPRRTGRTGCPPPACSRRSRSSSPTCSSTGRASRWCGSSASSWSSATWSSASRWRSTRSGRRFSGSPRSGSRCG